METVPLNRELTSRSLEETEQYAATFYQMLSAGDIVALYGPLGAGKTCFVRGVAIAAGVDRNDVTSPSFTIINEYPGGDCPIFHFDLYRLREPAEFYSTGGEEYFSRDGIILIEWAENGGEFIPNERYNVRMEIVDENRRRLTFSKIGP
jgi:tRNA threonylcarbamoyladenosine biosynthesis protein TsaE